ncbi:MAG TPA: NUDIX domain-containing protein [Jatrophihabitantaceae bacterium]
MPDIVRRDSKIVFENPWLRLRVDDIVYADGTPGTYSVLEKGDFVVVLPWDRGGFWLVEQYRYPVGQRCWEFPQGGWPSGQGGDQAELARHELREETGHTASTWQHLGRLFAVAGYSNQAFDVFLASGLVAGEPDREHTEQDMIHRWFTLDEVRSMIAGGRLADAHSVAALALLDASGWPLVETGR